MSRPKGKRLAIGGTREVRASECDQSALGKQELAALQCHLETPARLLPHSLLRFNRGPFSYVPGQPLADFRLSFDMAPSKNQEFQVNHAGYRLRESQCFLKSAGQLRCTTCAFAVQLCAKGCDG